jgi:hypothetical protein
MTATTYVISHQQSYVLVRSTQIRAQLLTMCKNYCPIPHIVSNRVLPQIPTLPELSLDQRDARGAADQHHLVYVVSSHLCSTALKFVCVASADNTHRGTALDTRTDRFSHLAARQAALADSILWPITLQAGTTPEARTRLQSVMRNPQHIRTSVPSESSSRVTGSMPRSNSPAQPCSRSRSRSTGKLTTVGAYSDTWSCRRTRVRSEH